MLLPDGSGIDYDKLDQMPDLDPDQTSQESIAYLQGDIAAYQGNSRQYSVESPVTNFQDALILLGYSLPRFGADGKFGPETQTALKQFQTDNKLESVLGRMDRLTAKTLALQLKRRGVLIQKNFKTHSTIFK